MEREEHGSGYWSSLVTGKISWPKEEIEASDTKKRKLLIKHKEYTKWKEAED